MPHTTSTKCNVFRRAYTAVRYQKARVVERSLASGPQTDPSEPPSGCETQTPAPSATKKPYTTKKTYKFYLADTDSDDEDWSLDLPVLR